MCQVWSLQESSKVLYKKLKHESFYLHMYLNRRDIGIVSRAENNGERKKRTTVDSKLTSRRGMGDLHLDRSMLQTHYRSEDSHRGPFKASGRNLARSDLKCSLRDGTTMRQTCSRQWHSPACHLRIRPASYTHCHIRPAGHTVDTCCNVNRYTVVLVNTLLGFKGSEVQLIAG